MAFSSIGFLFFFLPVFFALYFTLPAKNGVLLAGSLLFYAWGDPAALPVLLTFILLNWGCGLLAERRWVFALGIAANLSLLVWFKYAGFIVRQLDAGLIALGMSPLVPPAVVLPLGISFFAFQGISYLTDIRRGVTAPQRSLFRFATYKAMFPPLIAGPIVRYSAIAGSLEHRRPSLTDIREGIVWFITGLAQKILLANTFANPVDRIFSRQSGTLTASDAWLGAVLYALQIYFDFNGYTNIARGLGRMMGFTLPPNFDLPYRARSMREFWRRWHISLSSWFADYLYIPLGGNRLGAVRTAANLLLVFVLCGLWHGAAWNFLVWGLWHGLFLSAERTLFGNWLERRPSALRHFYLLLVVIVGWVPFRAANLNDAWSYIRAMTGASGHGEPLAASILTPTVTTALVIGALFSVWRPDQSSLSKPPFAALTECACVALLVLCCAQLASGTYNPFIYFRF